MDKQVIGISEHISYREATHSQTAIRKGIDNTPNEEQLINMQIVADVCFEPIRKWYGKPLKVSSFFRCKELNQEIGGSPTSQHMAGKAIDIDTGDKEENKKIFEWAKANLIYDQLIKEGVHNDGGCDWVHISFDFGHNRNQVLYANFVNGRTVYSK